MKTLPFSTCCYRNGDPDWITSTKLLSQIKSNYYNNLLGSYPHIHKVYGEQYGTFGSHWDTYHLQEIYRKPDQGFPAELVMAASSGNGMVPPAGKPVTKTNGPPIVLDGPTDLQGNRPVLA